jgi:hypothetical protein
MLLRHLYTRSVSPSVKRLRRCYNIGDILVLDAKFEDCEYQHAAPESIRWELFLEG